MKTLTQLLLILMITLSISSTQAAESTPKSKNHQVRLLVWNHEKPLPLFIDDSGMRLPSTGAFLQNLLKDRFGHSSLIVGEIQSNGAPTMDSLYLSFPYGNSFLDDFKKYYPEYKNIEVNDLSQLPSVDTNNRIRFIDLPNIDDQQYNRLQEWYYYGAYGLGHPECKTIFKSNVTKRKKMKAELERAFRWKKGSFNKNIQKQLSGDLSQYMNLLEYKRFPKEHIKQLDEFFKDFLELDKQIESNPISEEKHSSLLEELKILRERIYDALGEESRSHNIDDLLVATQPSSFQNIWNMFQNDELPHEVYMNMWTMQEIIQELSKITGKYERSFRIKSNNCTHATAKALSILYNDDNLINHGPFPPNPIDSMHYANHLLNDKQNRQIDSTLAIAALPAAAAVLSVGAMYKAGKWLFSSKSK